MGSKKPSTAHYNQNQAIASQNRVNQAVANQTYADVNSPLGGYYVSVDPNTGQMTVNKTLSQNSNVALATQGGLLGQYISNPQDAQRAYYNRQMGYITPTFQQQASALEQSLANRGIQRGSAAWNSAMNNLADAQARADTTYANNALFNGQQYQSNIAGMAGNAGSLVIDPTLLEGQQGAGMSDLYDALYQNKLATYQTEMANNNAAQRVMGTVGGVAGGILGGYFSGGNPGAISLGASIGGMAGNAAGATVDKA